MKTALVTISLDLTFSIPVPDFESAGRIAVHEEDTKVRMHLVEMIAEVQKTLTDPDSMLEFTGTNAFPAFKEGNEGELFYETNE